jgi:hypothetical protein
VIAAAKVISALARKRRDGALDLRVFAAAKRRLATIERGWNEVTHYDAVRAVSSRSIR